MLWSCLRVGVRTEQKIDWQVLDAVMQLMNQSVKGCDESSVHKHENNDLLINMSSSVGTFTVELPQKGV